MAWCEHIQEEGTWKIVKKVLQTLVKLESHFSMETYFHHKLNFRSAISLKIFKKYEFHSILDILSNYIYCDSRNYSLILLN